MVTAVSLTSRRASSNKAMTVPETPFTVMFEIDTDSSAVEWDSSRDRLQDRPTFALRSHNDSKRVEPRAPLTRRTASLPPPSRMVAPLLASPRRLRPPRTKMGKLSPRPVSYSPGAMWSSWAPPGPCATPWVTVRQASPGEAPEFVSSPFTAST